MAFQLDTSGAVAATEAHDPAGLSLIWLWDDLSPFAQGYVEALFAAHEYFVESDDETIERRGFSDLAPETLARIIADCEGWCAAVPSRTSQRQVGSDFWRFQQAGKVPEAPPLTVQLGDDGKVRFADA